MSKLWGGRFTQDTHKEVESFTSSLSIDQRLWKVDIQASIAHAQMLGRQNIIPPSEAQLLIQGLADIAKDLESGTSTIDPCSEDIHSDIEKKLAQKIGSIAGKLHTARSRNDQVATDIRIYLRTEVTEIEEIISKLQGFLVQKASEHLHTLLPGMTHTQHAQPVSLAQHLLAYFWMLERDRERFHESQKRINHLPLGAAALAGTGFPTDRLQLASDLGFDSLCENSLDAVSDRDFIVEFLSSASLSMMHLSKLSEELVLWSTPEFGFVELADEVTTGSSIMPQKKNPDVAELIRGRVGLVYGDLMGALTMMKALPLAYNRDLQEDKTFLFRSVDTLKSCLRLTHLMLTKASFKAQKMKSSLEGDFSNATDLADYLVTKGVSFRIAHEIVGKLVQYCLENKIKMEALTLPELKKTSAVFEQDVLLILSHEAVMNSRSSRGGTSPTAVAAQLELAKKLLKKY
ncbi:MAG: argininosuccinate lyase [Deltaproteobacteria bacterium]|jgi:argininosuccinate lyase|nr:argininosuccinate lyase [Deltaproteobacteria bacterium]